MPCLNLDKQTLACYHSRLDIAQLTSGIWDMSSTLVKKGNILSKTACFQSDFTGCRRYPIRHRANVAMSLI